MYKRITRYDTIARCLRTLAVATAVLSFPSGVLATCPTCQGIVGLGLQERDGTTWAIPAAAMWDLGLGAPRRVDASTLPVAGGPRDYRPDDDPYIKFPGGPVITLDESDNVLVDGVQRALWSWDSNNRKLTAPGGYEYSFNSNGLVTSTVSSGRTATFTYDGTYTDRLTKVTDSFGNEWNYGFSSGEFDYAPTYVINPDATRKIEFTYRSGNETGRGGYERITVNKPDGESWTEIQHIDYHYDDDDRIADIVTVSSGETSTTHIEYVDGTEGGHSDPVRRVGNQKLQIDVVLEYRTEDIAETYGGTKTYGVTRVRRRATCSSSATYSSNDNSNTADRVTDYYYYRDTDSGPNTFVYKVVGLESDGQGGLQAYSTVKYQVYGYLDRFSASPPTYYAALKGMPWKIVDARGNETTYDYSTENGMVTKTTLPTDDDIQYWYVQDGSNNDTAFVEKVKDARDKYTKYTHDATYPLLITEVGVSSSFDSGYDTVREMSYYGSPSQKAMLLQTVTVPDIEGTDDMITTYDYEDIIASTTNYRSSPTEEKYSWYNGSSYETKSTTASFYADGRTRWDKDARYNQSDYIYDAECRLLTTFSPADSTDTGTATDSGSNWLEDSGKSWYDDQLAGMALQVEFSSGSWTTFTVSGNTAHRIDIVGSGLDNASGHSYKVRPRSELAYSACCGQVEEETDSTGRKTYYQYDEQGRVWKIRNSETTSSSTHPLVEYTYNDLGQKTEVRTYRSDTDSTNRTTSYTYDQLGRVIQVTYPTNGGTRLLWDEYYQYDKAGNLVAKLVGVVDGGGNKTDGSITAYEYDSLGRLVEVDYDYSSSVWPVTAVDSYGDISITSADVTYGYDGGSSLKTQMAGNSSTSSYSYDKYGRLEYYTPPLPANYRVEYAYNAAGEKTSVTVKESGAGKYRTAYAYFKNGWLKQVKGQKYASGNWSDVTTVDFEYDETGNVTKRKNNGDSDVQTEYAYNARSEAKTVDHKLSQTSKYKLDYTRDGVGTPLQIAFDGDSFQNAYINANIVRYGYDPAGRLSGQTWGHQNNGWVQDNLDTWAYDWVGNRDPSSNTYNQVDELVTNHQYDMLGNLEYDPDSSSSPRTRYHYNPSNLLTQVDYISGGNTTTTGMTWDAEARLLRVQTGSDTWGMLYDVAAGTPAVLLSKDYVDSATAYAYYVRLPGGELLCSFDNSETPNKRYYHFDSLGSTVLATNGSGTVSASKTYDAWGAVLAGSGTTAPYGYVGELGYYTYVAEQGTAIEGTLQLWLRPYDPELGRFTQRDPIGYDDGPNVYAYGHGNPIVNTDPWGLKWCPRSLKQCLLLADMRYEYNMSKAYLDYAKCIWGAAKYPPPISLILAWRCNARFTKDEGKAVFQHEADIANCYIDYGDK